MKVSIVNGSPKAKDSTSEQIIRQMVDFLGESALVQHFHAVQLAREGLSGEALVEILKGDAILFVFPLYVDSLPVSLIKLLSALEAEIGSDSGAKAQIADKPHVYAVVNCGFFEAKQTTPAVSMIKHFADRTGLSWGYGIGIGGGGMLAAMSGDWSRGPVAGVYRELSKMAEAIKEKASIPNVFISPGIPRFVYKFAAEFNMKRYAKQSGAKNIKARPYKQ